MKTYRLFFVSVYRFIWNTFLYDISSILLIIIFKLKTPLKFIGAIDCNVYDSKYRPYPEILQAVYFRINWFLNGYLNG